MLIRLLANISLCLIGLFASLKATSQVSITGTQTCITPGTQYQYVISGNWNTSTYMEWCVTGGTLVDGNTCKSGTPVPQIYVIWNSGTTGTISLYTNSGSATLNVTSSPPSFQAGNITGSNFQNVYYNATPATITCSAATGGSCSPSINYQWQESFDNVTFRDITGATGQNLSFTGPLSQTAYTSQAAYYRRLVKESISNTSAISDVAAIYLQYTSVDYENRNYIRENSIVVPGITSWYQADQLATGQKFQFTNYLDGLGRSIQSVSKQTAQLANNTWADNVSVHSFDDYGREDKTYLPYASSTAIGKFKSTAMTEQLSFIQSKFSDQGYTYATTVFENNSLSRVTKTMLPGNAWGNSNIGTSYSYDFNNSTEIIKKWEIGYEETDLPVTAGNYTAGQLFKTNTTDEKGKLVIEYKDISGNLILSKVQDKEPGAGLITDGYGGWVCTYYVYDDFGRLRFTISPKAVDHLVTTKGVNVDWQIDASLASELCFSNYYDNLGGLIIKHSPGAGNQEMVYDQRNRMVYNRDASDKAKKRWLVNLSDGFDRQQVSGLLYRNTNDYTRSELQTIANGVSISPVTISSTTAGNTGSLPSLVVSVRETWRNEYLASEDIVLNPGFESSTNDYFEARIDNTPPAPQTQQIASSGNFIPSDGSLVTLSVNYYDDYNYTDAKAFSNNYSFPANSSPNTLSTVAAKRTFGSLTGQKVRVIDDEDYTDDNFLMTSVYYDEHGNLLQQISQNYLQATAQASNPYNDVLTNQYDFAGKLLSSCFKETVPGTVIQNFPVITTYEYDILGRVKILSKSYNNQPYKKLLQYSYDELGQMVSKKLSPDYNNGNGLETLKYDYNIQGWLTGINKGYIDNTQWGNYFGMALGDENADQRFPSATYTKQYNGNIGGAIWKSQGDNKPRKYDYDYFNTGYLKIANFQQKENSSTSTAWNVNKYDFSVPQLVYDANGNLKKMQQKGLIPGQTASALIDDLTYEYAGNSELSNRLNKVTDAAATGTANGKLGDFSTTNSLQQYVYNEAGNLIKDYNKNVQDDANANTDLQKGILYNILNKPYKVTIKDKYVMQYVYDAIGNKLARKITNTSVTPNTTKWQYYINDMVLEDYEVQFFVNETGRLRVSKDVSFAFSPAPALTIGGNNGMLINGKPAFFDFYIADHLDNTRMVLTEEEHSETHKATMEIADTREKDYEERMFGNVDANGNPAANNELIATRNDITPAWSSHYNDPNNKKASKLNQTKPVGPNVFLKVMAGDLLNLRTDYFYNETPSGSSSIANTIISSLVNALVGSSASAGSVKNFSSQVQTQLDGTTDFTNFLNNPTGAGTPPNAHLNWLFFDENFNPVNQGANRVATAGDNQSITVSNITVAANGYAFVYLSNSSNISVYFDEFWVTHKRGRILQENHYYPYGLQIASISSKAAGKMDNMYRYHGAYSEFEEETGWNDFDLRTYDTQIGRWTGVDPYDQFASGYIGMGNNPISLIDPDGGGTECCLEAIVRTTVNHSAVAAKFAFNAAMTTINTLGPIIYNYSVTNGNGVKETFASPSYLGNATTYNGQHFTSDGTSQDVYTEHVSFMDQRSVQPPTLSESIAKSNKAYFGANAFRAIGRRSGNITIYRNGRGETQQVASPTAAGNDEYVSAMVFNIITLGASVTGKAATGGYSTIYRAVSKAELDDIAKFGFRNKAGAYETGKLFAPTLKEAAQFGKNNFMFDGIPNTIIKVRVPNNVLNAAYKFGADGMNAISIPANQLYLLKGTPYNFSPLLR